MNAATAAAAAAVSATNSTTMPISDVERFQFLAQSPYFMQNGNMLANMMKILPKLANNMAFSNFIFKQNLSTSTIASANYNELYDQNHHRHQQHQEPSFCHFNQNQITNNNLNEKIENSIKGKFLF